MIDFKSENFRQLKYAGTSCTSGIKKWIVQLCYLRLFKYYFLFMIWEKEKIWKYSCQQYSKRENRYEVNIIFIINIIFSLRLKIKKLFKKYQNI